MPERRDDERGDKREDERRAIEQERRAGGGATVAGRGDRDEEAVAKGLERLEQAGGN
jgi:hypothetical protein